MRGWFWIVSLAACGGATPTGPAALPNPLSVAALYPLDEGNVWSYDIDTGEGPPTLSITRVIAHTGARVEVSTGGGDPVVYEIRPEGIFKPASDGWLLHEPVSVGESWTTTAGRRATVQSTTDEAQVEGRARTGCARIEETDVGGGRTISTTYCPWTGPVLVESSLDLPTTGRSVSIRATLRGLASGRDMPSQSDAP